MKSVSKTLYRTFNPVFSVIFLMTGKAKHMRVFVWFICTYLYLFASRSYKRLFHTSEQLHGFRLEMLLWAFIISNLANFVTSKFTLS
jgi:hypothetical protein